MPIAETIKVELKEILERYRHESAIDHLDAFLADIRDELIPFCREVDAQRDEETDAIRS